MKRKLSRYDGDLKICTACDEAKPVCDYYRRRASDDGLQATCKPCNDAARKAYHHKRPDLVRGYKLAKYGLTLEQYDTMKEGGCDCCGTLTPKGVGDFHVDHDHETGLNRGILCHSCNVGIGALGDDTKGVERALEYLQRHYGIS